jgi:hypothetical protein
MTHQKKEPIIVIQDELNISQLQSPTPLTQTEATEKQKLISFHICEEDYPLIVPSSNSHLSDHLNKQQQPPVIFKKQRPITAEILSRRLQPQSRLGNDMVQARRSQ